MERREDQRGGMLISAINGQPAAQHFLAPFLQDAGFHVAPMGLNFRRVLPSVLPSASGLGGGSLPKVQ
jgi:hypothetical protein